MYNLYILYVQLVHLICTVLVANSVCFETFFVENANDNPNGIKCYKEDRKLNKTLQCFVYLFAHVSLLFQILQPSEKNLVHGLDVAALPGDVFPHGIEVAEEFTESVLYQVGSAPCLVSIWVHNHVDALADHLDVYISIGHNRVAVVVNPSGLLAVDVQVLCLECLYFLVLVKCLVHHFDGHLWRFQSVERLHDDNVEQPVAH